MSETKRTGFCPNRRVLNLTMLARSLISLRPALSQRNIFRHQTLKQNVLTLLAQKTSPNYKRIPFCSSTSHKPKAKSFELPDEELQVFSCNHRVWIRTRCGRTDCAHSVLTAVEISLKFVNNRVEQLKGSLFSVFSYQVAVLGFSVVALAQFGTWSTFFLSSENAGPCTRECVRGIWRCRYGEWA